MRRLRRWVLGIGWPSFKIRAAMERAELGGWGWERERRSWAAVAAGRVRSPPAGGGGDGRGEGEGRGEGRRREREVTRAERLGGGFVGSFD